VNNAAIQGPIGPVWENDWEKWQATLQVNLLSPVALCRAVLPSMMKNRYGKIINLSGGGATQARPKFSAYASAKSGLVRFSETLAEEVKTFNIDVNCIAPGVMNTEMLNEIVRAGAEKTGDKEFSDACKHAGTDSSALDRAAELCVFLASSQSDGVTGKLISAVWDPWKELPSYIHDIKNSDIYTLSRFLPKDRGKKWGDL
jgi:3-oxoacyl-[acyl-carrier protein] reductase